MQLRRLVPTPDLLESLYFGWSERPYRRATLAVALKTVTWLERELHARQAAGGMIRDAELAAMLDWLEAALARATREEARADFRPDRMEWDTAPLTGAPQPGTPVGFAPGFAFMDRTSATRYDPVLGDFDLLACLGMGIYGVSSRTALSADHWSALAARAEALGVTLVTEASGAAETPSGKQLAVKPLSLATLLSTPEEGSGIDAVPAVVDPPEGESWGASLARRSLLRGPVPGRNVLVLGWRESRGADASPAGVPDGSAIRLAMWVHALAGQALGVIEGWRDLRDGSPLPYAPWVTHPDEAEAIAHTALDLRCYAREVRACAARPGLVVVIDATAVSRENEDRWSPEAVELFDLLVDRQLRYDVIPSQTAKNVGLGEYRAVLLAAEGGEAAAAAERLRGQAATVGANVKVVVPPGGGTPGELGRYLKDLPDPILSRDLRDPADFVAYESDGGVASRCLVFTERPAKGKPCLAVVNLRNQARSIVLGNPAGDDGLPFRDVLSGETITTGRGPVRLAAYQVRLLTPTDTK